MDEVKALNPGVSNEQAQAILICSTKTIEARLEKHPAALIQAHVTLINGMGKDAMDKLNQDSEFRNNSEQRRPDPMVTWNPKSARQKDTNTCLLINYQTARYVVLHSFSLLKKYTHFVFLQSRKLNPL